MAAASYNTDLSDLVADSAATGNWAALGGGASGLNVETDYFIEGTRCISKNAWAGATKGMVEDTTATSLSTGSGKAVYLWVTHHTPGSLAVKASGGITVCLGSASNQLNRYFYAGSDTIDYGAPWVCAVVDPDNATANSGTVAVTAMDTYGAEANLPVGGPTKGAPFGIDEIRYGRTIEVNDGVGAQANFTDMAAQNDSQTNRWGQFQRTPGSATNFTQQCRIEFGDTTNTTACDFSDSNKNINIADLEHVATDFIELDVTQASTVALTNISFTATAGANTRGNWVSTSSTLVTLTSCAFTNFGLLGFDGNTTATGCTFRGTDKITQSGATLTNCVIDSNTNAISIAADSLNDITGCTFTSDGSNHAVDLGTIAATGSLTWNNTLSGYTATDGSTGNEAILVNVASGQHLTINVSGGTTPTVYNTGTGTFSVDAAVDVTLTGLVAGTEIHAYTGVAGAAATEIGTGIESSGTSYTFSQSVGGANGFITLIKTGYKFLTINMLPYSASNQTIPVQQTQDRGYNNP